MPLVQSARFPTSLAAATTSSAGAGLTTSSSPLSSSFTYGVPSRHSASAGSRTQKCLHPLPPDACSFLSHAARTTGGSWNGGIKR